MVENGQEPIVCLGMPLYNQTDLLRKALNAIRSQTFSRFRLVVLDDSTDSEPGRIVNACADEDSRIIYIRNPERRGMIDNWRACVEAAGGSEYFAWVADHDLWESTWLESLVEALDRHPAAVLAYPLSSHMDAEGRMRKKKLVHRVSTVGLPMVERVGLVCREARGYGKMVYGLYRLDALRRAGTFRHLLFPDVILLLELSMQGEFVLVDQPLWHRRRMAGFSSARQRETLFVHKPWYIYLPWPLVNFSALMWNRCLSPAAGTADMRACGGLMAFMYLVRWIQKFGEGSFIGSYSEWRHGKKPWMQRLKKQFRGK
jgi:glycosyltransferase involved in cell wall biosynthesis